MTTLDLDAIRARVEAATQGPWEHEPWAFIAHARTDIPALLAEVDRLTTERDQAKQACQTLGSVIDSVLGATLQARFACTVCGYRAESPVTHRPGHRMRVASGFPWLTNSAVNLAAALAAGIVAFLLASAGQ